MTRVVATARVQVTVEIDGVGTFGPEENQRPEMALAVIDMVKTELGAALALRRVKG